MDGPAGNLWRDPATACQDDPDWSATIDEVSGFLAKAGDDVQKGDLAASQATLEGVHEAFVALHTRNGIETFSDRMNAYHAAMEPVLGIDMDNLDDAAVQGLHEQAAVLAYLAQDVLAALPPGATESAELAALASAFQASVDQFVAAARARDAEAIRTAVAGLNVPYSKLFPKFD